MSKSKVCFSFYFIGKGKNFLIALDVHLSLLGRKKKKKKRKNRRECSSVFFSSTTAKAIRDRLSQKQVVVVLLLSFDVRVMKGQNKS